ncbi:hypothetical protein RUND412_003410 [Rhizina undulata]
MYTISLPEPAVSHNRPEFQPGLLGPVLQNTGGLSELEWNRVARYLKTFLETPPEDGSDGRVLFLTDIVSELKETAKNDPETNKPKGFGRCELHKGMILDCHLRRRDNGGRSRRFVKTIFENDDGEPVVSFGEVEKYLAISFRDEIHTISDVRVSNHFTYYTPKTIIRFEFNSSEGDELFAQISPIGCEYYLMIRVPSDSATEVARYEKYLLVLDPSLQIDATATKADDLDTRQVVAVANLLKERNARTVGNGQWVLSGLRKALGSEEFRLAISFCRYGDDFVDSESRVAVENAPNDSAEVSAEIAASNAEDLETEVSQSMVQQPDSFNSELHRAREAVENTWNEVSEEVAITTVATEEVGAEISGIMIQQPDSFDPDLDSTIGRRSPTPTSDLDSGARTPVPLVVRTEKETEIDELDRMEDAACNILSSMNSVIALSILRGVLVAREMLMGNEQLQTLKTMENLGFWYFKYGWDYTGSNFFAQSSGAQIKHLRGEIEGAWPRFEKVLEARMDVLGKTHHTTLDAIKQLEETYRKWGRNHAPTERLPLLKSLVKYEMEVRGENHKHTLEAMDLLVETLVEETPRETYPKKSG